MKTVNKQNLPLLDYRKIEPLQGELKDLSDENFNKLYESFKKHGFFIPVFIWKHEDKNYCLDGHGRLRVLNKKKVKFTNTDYKIPIVEIEADNITDAKEKLLKITSQYQRITYEGLDAYIAEAQLPEAEVFEAVAFDALTLLGQDQNEKEEIKEKQPELSIKITFRNLEDLENCLVEVQEVCDKYETKGISVNDGTQD